MELKKPLFIVSLVLCALVVLVELIGPSFIESKSPSLTQLCASIEESDIREDCLDDDNRSEIEKAMKSEKPPGYAIRYLAMVDGPLLFTMLMFGLSLILKERKTAKVQGPTSCVSSCLFILGGLVLLFMVFLHFLFMVSLLLAVPFGTIAYFATYAFFPKSVTATILSVLMILKIAFCICLVLAHTRFLQNKGLVLLILSSLLANFIVALLHGIVPSFLVSISDAVAAIILAIIGLIWALSFFLKSIVPSLKALNLKK